MGYALAHSACYSCKRIFSYNPMRVPSISVDGQREPVCLDCMIWVNNVRELRGMPPHPIHLDAYEPIDERELP